MGNALAVQFKGLPRSMKAADTKRQNQYFFYIPNRGFIRYKEEKW